MPSYSRRESTSGAMYAGVPTVDLGFECSSDDCNQKKRIAAEKKGVSATARANDFLLLVHSGER